MSESSGADNLTYTSRTYTNIISSYATNANYFGIQNTSATLGYTIYMLQYGTTSFTNTYSILGGGGSTYSPGGPSVASVNGGHAIQLTEFAELQTITNLGALLGGGGGAGDRAVNSIGGNGGAGGGGGGGYWYDSPNDNSAAGGSIVLSTLAGSGSIDGSGGNPGGTGGGGPSGNGGSFIDASGGLGKGSPGGNGPAGGNAGTNNYNFTYGGGAGTYTPGQAGGGGGGYGCGWGGICVYPHNYGGAGGGGGGYPSVSDNTGGYGGYSIYNAGSIINLINAQGGPKQKIQGGLPFPYGPLFYGTTNASGLTNYKIVINSTTSYGQLWNIGWGTLGSELLITNFDIDYTYSNIPYGTNNFYQVLVNVNPTNPISRSGASLNGKITWTLTQGTPVTIGTNISPSYSTTYSSYNLSVTNTTPQSNGFLFNTFFL